MPLLDLTRDDLTNADTVFQIGLPPSRIDLLTGISGVRFDEAWGRRMRLKVGVLEIPVLGRDDFVANKRAAGRAKDLADLELLDETER